MKRIWCSNGNFYTFGELSQKNFCGEINMRTKSNSAKLFCVRGNVFCVRGNVFKPPPSNASCNDSNKKLHQEANCLSISIKGVVCVWDCASPAPCNYKLRLLQREIRQISRPAGFFASLAWEHLHLHVSCRRNAETMARFFITTLLECTHLKCP